MEPDPSSYVSCRQIPPNGFNFARYCDAAVERALGRALSSYDRNERRAEYALVQRKLTGDVPYVFLWQPSEIDVIPNALQGFEPSAKSGPYASVARWRM